MEKSEFLKEISSMTREEIDEKIKNNYKSKIKLVYPVLILRKSNKKRENNEN